MLCTEKWQANCQFNLAQKLKELNCFNGTDMGEIEMKSTVV